MPGVKVQIGRRVAYLDFVGEYKPGDPAPEGYCDWHEWAKVQHRAGLRQQRCGSCLRYQFPQELSGEVITARGPRKTIAAPVCKKCHAAAAESEDGDDGRSE